MMEGTLGPDHCRDLCRRDPEIQPGTRNIMGMQLPVFVASGKKKDLATRGYGLIGTSSVIDEAAEVYEDLTVLIIRHAEQVAAIQALTNEITRLKRRVNALFSSWLSRNCTGYAMRSRSGGMNWNGKASPGYSG